MSTAGTELKFFRVERNGHVAEVILNNPKKLNTMTVPWAHELESIVDSLEKDDDVYCILIWAEGRIFTAGLDLKELASFSSQNVKGSQAVKSLHFYKTLRAFQKPMTSLDEGKKPVVVAVHSQCIGGGVDLVTACDIRLCTKDAMFSVKETQVAMVPDLGTIPRLTRIVGRGIYKEMVYTGEPLNARRAHQFGLVNEVYEDKEALLTGARALCEKIASNSPLVIQGAKRILHYAEDHTMSDTLDFVGLWNTSFLESEDLMESIVSFMQKRKPVYRNKL